MFKDCNFCRILNMKLTYNSKSGHPISVTGTLVDCSDVDVVFLKYKEKKCPIFLLLSGFREHKTLF